MKPRQRLNQLRSNDLHPGQLGILLRFALVWFHAPNQHKPQISRSNIALWHAAQVLMTVERSSYHPNRALHNRAALSAGRVGQLLTQEVQGQPLPNRNHILTVPRESLQFFQHLENPRIHSTRPMLGYSISLVLT